MFSFYLVSTQLILTSQLGFHFNFSVRTVSFIKFVAPPTSVNNAGFIQLQERKMPQGSIHWQGTQRRACGPGAHWNVQVYFKLPTRISN